MSFYIGIEDLAANALIESMNKGNKTFFTYKEIEEYGSKVIQLLISQNEKAVLILSRNNTDAMFRNYSRYFEEDTVDGASGIRLKDEIGVDDLIEEFRGYLALDVLMAFIKAASVRVQEA